MKLGEAMYKSQQGGAGPGAAGPGADGGASAGGAAGGGEGAAKDEKVVDADFEEVDDKKNKRA
jgi:molecular chaperone DnaK